MSVWRRIIMYSMMSFMFVFGSIPEYKAEHFASEEIIQRLIEIGDYDIDALPCLLLIGILDGEVDPSVYIAVVAVIDTMIRLYTRNIHNFSDDFDYDIIFDNVYEGCIRLGVELPILSVLDSIY